tara:strand:- start:179 stop:523 length:345 start_codon:yes stop_codon:yes gene_type:complete
MREGAKEVTKLICAVCAQDGIISNIELNTTFKLVNASFGKISKKEFDLIVEEFFDEDKNLEKYLIGLPELVDVNQILKICFESAGSDGLDVRENFAFDKVCKFFQVDTENYINK